MLSKYSPHSRSELSTPRLKGRRDTHKSFDDGKKKQEAEAISKEKIYAAILDFPPKVQGGGVSIFEP